MPTRLASCPLCFARLVLSSQTSSPAPDAQSPRCAPSNLTRASSCPRPAPSSRSYALCRQEGRGDVSVPLTAAPGQPPAPGCLCTCHSEVREGAQEQVCPGTAAGTRGHSPVPLPVPRPSGSWQGRAWPSMGRTLSRARSGPRSRTRRGWGLDLDVPRSVQKGKGRGRSPAVPGAAWKPRQSLRWAGAGVPCSQAPSVWAEVHTPLL